MRWNPFHPTTFISASADWTIKIWNSKKVRPVMSFDLEFAMVDVVWSPFNSGVFIALSLNKVFAYNLDKDRHTRYAEIKPSNKNHTNLAFNPFDPIFLAGDNYGQIVVIKMNKLLANPPQEEMDEAYM